MAEEWHYPFKNEPYDGTYNRATMTYRWRRRYVVTGVTGLPVPALLRRAPGASTYTRYVVFSHPTYRMYEGIAGGLIGYRNVYCYPVSLNVVNQPAKDCLEVDVEYTGRVCGTHGLMSRTQMASEIRYESLEPDGDGKYKGIGVEFEGVPVDVPMVIHTATHVMDYGDYHTIANVEDIIAGSVNEQGWEAPWGYTYDEGQVIYLGPQQAVLDRDTQTVMVQHVFARMQNRKDQHIFRWREYEQTLSDEGQKIRKYKSGPMEEAKILKIAGKDKWWDDTTDIPEFASIGLEPPIM